MARLLTHLFQTIGASFVLKKWRKFFLGIWVWQQGGTTTLMARRLGHGRTGTVYQNFQFLLPRGAGRHPGLRSD